MKIKTGLNLFGYRIIIYLFYLFYFILFTIKVTILPFLILKCLHVPPGISITNLPFPSYDSHSVSFGQGGQL